MQKQSYIVLSLISLILIVIIILVIVLLPKADLSPTSSELEVCNTLSYSSENAINLVFFADKETAELYESEFFKVSPLKENKDKFNFYYISDYVPECEIYKGVAVLCYSKEIVRKAGSCPNDYILSVKEHPISIRSSSYMNALSLNKNHPSSVIQHEFGHAFANLAEEYSPARIPDDSENCASTCSDFNDIEDGCFQECSDSEHYRSIESGIMRSLKSDSYGSFNEYIISEKIKSKTGSSNYITGSTVSETLDCSQERYYLIEATLVNSEIKVINKTIETGCLGSSGAGSYSYSLILKDNSIFQETFNPELIYTDGYLPDQGDIDGEPLISDISFNLKVPVIENAQTLQILQNSNLLNEISLNDIGARPCKKL